MVKMMSSTLPSGSAACHRDGSYIEAGVPLTKTIREIEVGQQAFFPIERHGSVKAIVSRLKKELLRSGWDARVSIDYDNYQVIVRRTR